MAGLAERTRDKGKHKVDRWIEFCTSYHQSPLDAPELFWILFITQLAKEGKAKGTVEGYVAAIRSWLTDNGIINTPLTKSIHRIIKGIEKNPINAPQRPKQAPRFPLTVSILLMLRSFINFHTWQGSLLWFACLLGVLGLLRSGEFTIDNQLSKQEQQRRLVRLKHLSFINDNADKSRY